MKRLALYLLLSVPSLAAVDGTVINQTTGKPAANATVTLYKLGQAGPEALESVHTDAQGKFSIKQSAEGGPHNLQSTYEGVTYAHVLRPGSPTTGITLEVYNASRQPRDAKVANHFLILQPSPGQLVVSEVFLYKNEGKTAWNDPDSGTLKFYLPPAAKGVVKVQAKAPNGMPIDQLAQKTGKPDVYKVDFAIKPGETQFEVSYMVPYTSPARFGSKDFTGAAETLLVAPQGVTLKGDAIEFSRQEPRTQAAIYAAKKPNFEFEITGEMQASEQQGQSSEEANNGPTIEQLMPKLFNQVDGSASLIQKVLAVKWILLLALGILGLGFLQLYRREEPAEAAAAPAPTPQKPSREKPTRDNPTRNNATRNNPIRNNATRDNPIRDNPTRDNPTRDNPTRDNAIRDSAIRDNATRNNPIRDNAIRDDAIRDNPTRDNPTPDNPTRDKPSRDRKGAVLGNEPNERRPPEPTRDQPSRDREGAVPGTEANERRRR